MELPMRHVVTAGTASADSAIKFVRKRGKRLFKLFEDIDPKVNQQRERHRYLYEVCVAVLITTNALWLGIELVISGSAGDEHMLARQCVAGAFCALFGFDILGRIGVRRKRFFTGKHRGWNCFDLGITILMVAEFIGGLLRESREDLGFRQLTVILLLRLTRLIRIMRFVHMFDSSYDFRILLSFIRAGMPALLWVLLMSGGLVYLFGLGLTYATMRHCDGDTAEETDICLKFGSLARTSMSFFLAMFDGVEWGRLLVALEPLRWEQRALFVLQVSFLKIIVGNMILGYLLGIAKRVAKSARWSNVPTIIQTTEDRLDALKKLFWDLDLNQSGAISLVEMQLALEDPRIQSAFVQLKIDTSDIPMIFDLLDEAGHGAVDIEAFVAGIQRIDGDAGELGVKVIQKQCRKILGEVGKLKKEAGLGDSGCMTPQEALLARVATPWPTLCSPSTHQWNDAMSRVPLSFLDALQGRQPDCDRPEMRAMTLHELQDVRSLINTLCPEEQWSHLLTGEVLNPQEVTLYQFVHHVVSPKTAVDGVILHGLDRSLAGVGSTVVQMDAGTRCHCQGDVLEETPSGLRVRLHKGGFRLNQDGMRLFVGGTEVRGPTRVEAPGSLSYKELVSRTPTKSTFFCSHWWGERVFEFVECCEAHARIRGLDSSSATYWICAYANRQHELENEIGNDPEQTSFRKAMNHSQGVLLILDRKATPFTRIWCCFEIYCILNDDSKDFDIVTKHHGAPRLLSARQLPNETSRARTLREASFPISLLVKGMYAQLQDGEASCEADRDAILRYIRHTGPSHDGGDENLRLANNSLHANFARSAWPQALKRGMVQDFDPRYPGALRLPDVLRQDEQRRSLSMSLEHSDLVTDAEVINIAAGLPPNLQELCLSFEGCQQVSNQSVVVMAQKLQPGILRLKLDFLGCRRVGDAGLVAIAEHLPERLHELELHFDQCLSITSAGVKELARRMPRSVRIFRGTFRGTGVDRTFGSAREIQSFGQAGDNLLSALALW